MYYTPPLGEITLTAIQFSASQMTIVAATKRKVLSGRDVNVAQPSSHFLNSDAFNPFAVVYTNMYM